MDDNTKIFLDFFQNYKWPEAKPVCYRLYHDIDGLPLFYSTEDLPGTWIEVNHRDYELRDEKVRVVKGKLQHLPAPTAKRMRHSDFGTTCHPGDITIIVSPDEPHQCWSFLPHESH
jgi:hypothetical protein